MVVSVKKGNRNINSNISYLTSITLLIGCRVQPSGQDTRYIQSLLKVKSKMELQNKL